MAEPFLDTNILLRFLLNDDPARAPRARQLLAAIARGEQRAWMTDLVVFEVVFTLQRRYRFSRSAIASSVAPLLQLEGIDLPARDRWPEVFDLYLNSPLGIADCYHVVQMRRQGVTELYSWDTEFDRIPGLTRIEP